MEDRQINDFYEARRHIQSAMMGDTPMKTVQNRQCIDNMSDYDSEHHRITKSVRHRLDLGPIMLPVAQEHTTVESDAALKIQDKIEGKYKAHMQSNNGQYRNEMYKRCAVPIPHWVQTALCGISCCLLLLLCLYFSCFGWGGNGAITLGNIVREYILEPFRVLHSISAKYI